MSTLESLADHKLRTRVQEGQFYEAHQQLRVIAARYIKTSAYASAIDILFGGAQLLLNAGQGGSGGDLCLLLLEVYTKAAQPVTPESTARVLTLLRAFPAGEPTRKRFVSEAIAWSQKHGEFPTGDPNIHHVAGTLSAADGDARDAESHLLLGTRDSPPVLAKLEATWFAAAGDPSTAPAFAARAVLPYLLLGNLRAANQVLLLFTSNAALADAPGLTSQDVSGASAEIRVYPGLPLLNFLSLLLLACKFGDANVFRLLRNHYAGSIGEMPDWNEALDGIAEMYFGIPRPRQSNPLMDMMSSMFGGGGMGGGGAAGGRPRAAGLPAPGLD